MTAPVSPVAAAVREVRQKCDISQTNLARTLGVSTSFINDVERGRRDLTDQRIIGCIWAPVREALIAARIIEYRERIAWLTANCHQPEEEPKEIP